MEAERRRRRVARVRSKVRIRKKITGTEQRPRVSVFRSDKHIYAQIIVDNKATTLAAASTVDPEVRGAIPAGKSTKSVDAARVVGRLLAERAKKAGVSGVVFDRNGLPYHGRVQGVADGAREAGLIF